MSVEKARKEKEEEVQKLQTDLSDLQQKYELLEE